MVDSSSEKEDEYKTTTNSVEPLDVESNDGDFIAVTTPIGPSSHRGSEDLHGDDKIKPLQQVQSSATSITRTESHVESTNKKKPWYKSLNPLRWGGIPPVPETRKVCREYNAPFLSL